MEAPNYQHKGIAYSKVLACNPNENPNKETSGNETPGTHWLARRGGGPRLYKSEI